ncbi:MAG: formylglycine-generating enzyme family protein [Candidatus Synoicihabitans palmerolidicus]|nr:formylglycine-generating enzyme family protein [Candidatus Synoicihabitans palmerolidicus]
MGSRAKDPGEELRHRVVLPEAFMLGSFVVTQAQWRAVATRTKALKRRTDPSHFKSDRLPVEQVSWDDATAWCEALTQSGKLPEGWEARLPTEAEWKYACRAGTDTRYYNGDDAAALAQVAWFADNAGGQTHAVDEPVGGRVEQHPWGLFGMHGNVEEWCRDVYL